MSARDPNSATVKGGPEAQPRAKAQLGQLSSKDSASPTVSTELRGWIERVIAPILVEQYLREKGLKQEQTDG